MNQLSVSDMIKMIEIMTATIIENEVLFCELDSAAGDGDFGMSLAKGFKEIRNRWDHIQKEDFGGFLKDCGMIITEYCGGASGPIWGSAFRSAGKYAEGINEFGVKELSELMQCAVEGIQKRGGAKLGDKTMLDALIPATESLKGSYSENQDLKRAMEKSAQEAVTGADKTKDFIASKGRASYLGERSLLYPDAGATAVGVILSNIVNSFYN